MKRVVVGVEDLPHSQVALAWAARVAERRGAQLRVVHATGFPTLAVDVLAVEAIGEWAERVVAASAAYVAGLAPGVPVQTHVDRRRPIEALVDAAEEAELLVVGTHRLSAVERLFAGSLSYQVAAAAPCPTAVVPGPVPAGASGVVVGADGSADSLAAVRLAAAEAERTGQPLDVVHVWQDPPVWAQVDVFPEGLTEAVMQEETLLLAESVAGLAEQHPDLEVRQRLLRGSPARSLLEAAADATLLVIGSRGRHGLTRLLLGSTSHTVLLHAPCPVLVARTPHVRPQHG